MNRHRVAERSKPYTNMRAGRAWIAISLTAVLSFLCLHVACTPKLYRDGFYRASSTYDEIGFATVEIAINKGKIASVEISDYAALGLALDSDAGYEGRPEYKKDVEKRLIGKTDAAALDYPGAPPSYGKYKEAVAFALEKARKVAATRSGHFEGTFFGRSGLSDQGGYQIAVVTILEDKITSVFLNDVTSEGTTKDWGNYPYPTAVSAREAMAEAFIAKGDAGVDGYSGATRSSTGWIVAVNDALERARIR